MKTCPKCGKQFADDVKNCDKCGLVFDPDMEPKNNDNTNTIQSANTNTKKREQNRTVPLSNENIAAIIPNTAISPEALKRSAPKKAPAEKHPFLHIIKTIGASWLFLAGTVIYSIICLLQFIGLFVKGTAFSSVDALTSGGDTTSEMASNAFADAMNYGLLGILTGILSLLPAIIICAALWIFYLNCRSKKYSTFSLSSINLFRGVTKYRYIVSVVTVIIMAVIVFNFTALDARVDETKNGGAPADAGFDNMPVDNFGNGGIIKGNIAGGIKLDVISEKQAAKDVAVANEAVTEIPLIEEGGEGNAVSEGNEGNAANEGNVDYDYNGDGIIDEKDREMAAADTGNAEGGEIPYDGMPDVGDINGDGVVDELDMKAADGAMQGGVDLNGDGIIDESEMAAGNQENMPEQTTEETKTITQDARIATNIAIFMILGIIIAYILFSYNSILNFTKTIRKTIEDETPNKGTPVMILLVIAVSVIYNVILFIACIASKQNIIPIVNSLLSVLTSVIFGILLLNYKSVMSRLTMTSDDEI